MKGTKLLIPKVNKKSLENVIKISKPLKSSKDFEEGLEKKPISLSDVSQIFFASFFITGKRSYKRSVPSAGGIQPMKLFLFVNSVKGLERGVYYYDVFKKELMLIQKGSFIDESRYFNTSAISFQILITSMYEKVKRKYGGRSIRYCNIEAGEMSQNILLQGEAIKLKVLIEEDVDKFYLKGVIRIKDRKVREMVYDESEYEKLNWELVPLMMISLGRAKFGKQESIK